MDRRKDQTQQKDINVLLGTGKAARTGRLRRIAGWLAALAALAGLIYLFAGGNDTAGRSAFITEPAALRDITVIVTATGTVEPTNQVEISSELSGRVRAVHVDFNDEVKKGQVLLELDTVTLEAQVARSRAALAAAKARVLQAEATLVEKEAQLKRTSTLAERNVSSQTMLDSAQAEYDRAVASLASARADVEVAEAELAQNETSLSKAKIYSPVDGVVLKRSIEPGQTVAATFQAPVLLTLAEDLRKMELRIDVDEADIGKVKVGQSATFSVEAYQDLSFPAVIEQVRFAPETVNGVVTYKAILGFDNSSMLLRPGMTATANVLVSKVTGALAVPNAALRFRPPAKTEERSGGVMSRLFFRIPKAPQTSMEDERGRTRRIYVERNGEAVPVTVTIGATDGRHTEIAGGEIAPGTPVIVDVAEAKG